MSRICYWSSAPKNNSDTKGCCSGKRQRISMWKCTNAGQNQEHLLTISECHFSDIQGLFTLIDQKLNLKISFK